MNEEALMGRIVAHPGRYRGKPVLRASQVPVDQILRMLAAGVSPEIIMKNNPGVNRDDIRACLAYARRLVVGEPEHVEFRLLDMAA